MADELLSVPVKAETPDKTVLTSPSSSAGSNQGGVGYTSFYGGVSGSVPVGTDPVDGELMTGKRSEYAWIEITHIIG